MKKEGIMRINSYNKFFAEVAKIMHTDVKDVKQLDGRYKVELTNHVYLNVYRGVSGTLFIHDHRGIAHITSCYDFEDFKTMKDLYERLITDFGEDRIENVECDYNYKSDACIKAHNNFIHDCESVHKQMKARSNTEWHHVSLKTLANIDYDMLDEKRRLYMKVYRMTVNVTNTIYKCNRFSSIDNLRTNLLQTVRNMAKNGVIEWALVEYVKAKLDNCYLVKGVSSSIMAKTYNYNESRSYTKTFIF